MDARKANLNGVWAGLIVEELVRLGVHTFCMSPGSRCSPLTVAVAGTEGARGIVHYDERGAAYYALGYARGAEAPAALICTSGTAVANYFPAVVEAAMARVPLIVLTADRPPELLDTGANQAIDQVKVFGEYARYASALPCPSRAIPPEFALTTIDQAVYRAIRAPRGPAHLNCPFREPLAPTESGEDFTGYLAPVDSWLASRDMPWTQYAPPATELSQDGQRRLIQAMNGHTRPLLVIGPLGSQAERTAAAGLVNALGWPAFPDVLSGLRLGGIDGPAAPFYDLALASPRFQALCEPDLIVQIGGPPTSKRLAQFMDEHRAAALIAVADHPLRADALHRSGLRIEADIAGFCAWLGSGVAPEADPGWAQSIVAASTRVDAAVDDFLRAQPGLSELAMARLVSEELPEGAALVLGNSLPIREMERVAAGSLGARVAVANRGASGIDGTIATAAGLADGLDAPVTAVIGDVAALHDLNSLALLRQAARPVTLVIVNNNGGGIFHFLPIAGFEEVFEPYFAAPHGIRFERVAEAFGLGYAAPDTADGFVAAYRAATAGGAPSIIEVAADRAATHAMHQALDEAAVACLAGG
ncbi:MAG: 2-succinyl-5-enolpyruvyl-6-hydroxy-3-cyclohexene-1-carboxylic-acid synthase [Candidatus Hydrogenedentes bacterium]|nr:2-succinyl-5-enolpyruvyl-6-hydroxy-3-cyclohexene-1-carboxylic-acid synthase [Candidatus Hydrogenedentota bacterium]